MMEDSSPEHRSSSFSAQSRVLLGGCCGEEVETSTFLTQADAFFRKSLTFQKRNKKQNLNLFFVPVSIIVCLVMFQHKTDQFVDRSDSGCECACVDADITCKKECSFQSSLSESSTCPIPNPVKWPPLLQVPTHQNRATDRNGTIAGCNGRRFCSVALLATGKDRLFAKNLLGNLFTATWPSNFSDYLEFSTHFVLGTEAEASSKLFVEPAFFSQYGESLYYVQHKCKRNMTFAYPYPFATEVKCLKVLTLWRNSTSMVNDELFQNQVDKKSEKEMNEFLGAYDFLDSGKKRFNVNIWYKPREKRPGETETKLLHIPRLINMVSNAYLQTLRGIGAKMNLEYVNEMPKPAGKQFQKSDQASMQGINFVLVPLLLFPVMLTNLVHEKQQKLRMMMKMHGLGDAAYWTISYAFFLSLSTAYMFVFVLAGLLTGIKIFTSNSYAVQFVFYFVFINLQIVLAFLAATCFSAVKAARVGGFSYIFLSALVPAAILDSGASFSRSLTIAMEVIPAISLYKGLKVFDVYSFLRSQGVNSGFQWRNLGDKGDGMKEVLIIMTVEWLLLLPVAYWMDKFFSAGSGLQQFHLCFRPHLPRKSSQSLSQSMSYQQNAEVFVDEGRPDVHQERKMVEQLLKENSPSYAIVADNIKKVYPGRDGNPDKLAVRGLSLAVPSGECFGMLGPNGAGKTSFISMMIGHTTPTSGTAYVQGMDIRVDMDKIYTRMGVCPQFDLLWETLTAREHLLFYGRLKNLKGAALTQAVEDSLKSLNLYNGGVADKQAGKYSGGMKRRLSVAISLIGDPKVVYMDEPSTGLDPASRKLLWNVVKQAKRERAIYLTTHSMEEAEALCDRLGFFVDGDLHCIGNPKELKSRYGGYFILTVTTASGEEEEMERIVRRLCPNANKTYHLSGTQKFELPKKETRVADVLHEIANAKRRLNIQAWGLSDTTLEDVFIKVAKGAMKT